MSEKPPTPGEINWNELMTTDEEGAKQFYGDLFGWTVEPWPTQEGKTYWIMKNGDTPAAGIMDMPPNVPEGTPPCWGAYVTVEDIDALAGKVEGLGGKVLCGPMDIPEVGRFAVIQDPQGAAISAMTYAKKDCDS